MKEVKVFSYFWNRSSARSVLYLHRTKNKLEPALQESVSDADLPFVNGFMQSFVTEPFVMVDKSKLCFDYQNK